MRKTPHGLHCYSIFSWFTSILFLSLLSPVLVKSLDTITATQSLTNSQTIVSFNNVFELGFFTPGNSKSYVGIWYKNVADKTVVWVANRDDPLTNSSGALLKIDYRGNIVILDQFSNVIWSSSNQMKAVDTPVARLLDSGNFVLIEENDPDSKNYLWQSFDYPTDTLLPDMKLGWDLKTGLHRYLMSWKSVDDPSSGDYIFKLDRPGYPELVLSKGQVIRHRTGPWNGLRFNGILEVGLNYILNFKVVTNQDEAYYSFSMKNKSVSSRVIVNPSGVLQRFTWINTSKSWNLFWDMPREECDLYKKCGVYGICDTNVLPVCKCMEGFEPRNLESWNLGNWSDGCVRKLGLDCMEDGFLLLRNMKLPETSNAIFDRRMNLEECRTMCKKNCSCTAYANLNITGGGTGCVIWSGELL